MERLEDPKSKRTMKDHSDQFLKALQKELDKKVAAMNTTPNPEIDHLSPNDMFQILYHTFGSDSPVGFKKQKKLDHILNVPFLKLLIEFLLIVEKAGELKLTLRGNLPRKICFELYGKGIIKEENIESGIVKLAKEQDSIVLQNIKLLSGLCNLTKKRNNKLSLTSNGKRILKEEKFEALFTTVFQANYQKFNLGYHDGYPESIGLQNIFGYTVYLLLQYGQEFRDLEFYADKNLIAFPMLLEDFKKDNWSTPEEQYMNCYKIRIFSRFLDYYGLVEIQKERNRATFKEHIRLSATSLFRELFEIRKNKFQFRKSDHLA